MVGVGKDVATFLLKERMDSLLPGRQPFTAGDVLDRYLEILKQGDASSHLVTIPSSREEREKRMFIHPTRL